MIAVSMKNRAGADLEITAGEVIHADILTGHDGRSKGCGIVEFGSPADAQRAIEDFSEREFMGRKIFLREVSI